MYSSHINRSYHFLKAFRELLGTKIYLIFILTTLATFLESFGIILFFPIIEFLTPNGIVVPLHKQNALNDISVMSLNILDYLGISESTIKIVSLIIFAFLMKALTLLSALVLNTYIRTEMMKLLKVRIIDNVILAKYNYLDNLDSGELTSLANEQVNRSIQSFFYFGQFCTQLLNSIIYITLAFFTFFYYGLTSLIIGFLIFYAFLKINSVVHNNSRKFARYNGQLTSLLIQYFKSHLYLVSTNQQSIWRSTINQSIVGLADSQRKMGYAAAFTQALREPIVVSFLLALVLVELVVFNGSIGTLLVFLVLLYRGMNALIGTQQQWQNTLEWIGSFEAVQKLIAELGAARETRDTGLAIKNFSGMVLDELELPHASTKGQKLSGEYMTSDWILLSGPSGSGKTTLIKVLCGVLKPYNGDVKIDGNSLNSLNNLTWRSCIGLVTQRAVIFSGTILQNITLNFANDGCFDNEKLQRVLKVTGLLPIIDELGGLQTDVGEDGDRLSGGQRQRLAIARELYRDPKFLILDEATNALDAEAEGEILQNIKSLEAEIMLLVVSHNPNMKLFDKIIQL